MKKLLCKLGLHSWVTFYRNGIVFRYPVSRRCTRCLKKQTMDAFERKWKAEGWEERLDAQQDANLKFINKQP